VFADPQTKRTYRNTLSFQFISNQKETLMSGRSLRFINTLILILFCILGLTGLYGLVWPFPSSLFEIHRIAGWALIVLIPWKGAIALRSLSRGLSRRFDHSLMTIISILLTLATVTILVLVLMWTWQIGPYYVWIGPYAYSGIGWHWGIAFGLAPLFIIHVWRRWPHPKKVDFAGRRQALKLMGLQKRWLAGESLRCWQNPWKTMARNVVSQVRARRVPFAAIRTPLRLPPIKAKSDSTRYPGI
jgi:hypothetical protein